MQGRSFFSPAVRLVSSLVLIVGSFLAVSPVAAQPLGLGLDIVVSGLDAPTAIGHAGDERLFVAEREGRLRIVRGNVLEAEPFLDITDRVILGGERGLLGFAFHPDYAENGFFFVHYSDLDGNTTLSRFQVSADPDRAAADSEAVLLSLPRPSANHNGGSVAFGPDGYLYLALGDGGVRFDPQCFSLDTDSLFGKVLRLDVDSGSGAPPYYSIPADNPYADGGEGAPEVWSYGLRNPWRISFDRMTGDLYIADVGEGQREEVNFQAADAAGGSSYGWKVLEGTRCLGNLEGCAADTPGCDSPLHVEPVIEYVHEGGRCSVTGGHVYRGSAIPELDGWYLYGDFCSGEILLSREEEEAPWTVVSTGLTVPLITTFGEDVAGEVYVTGLPGTVYRVTGPTSEPFDCQENERTLCLGEGDRFQVRAYYDTFNGPSGTAMGEPITEDTGYLWFFRDTNVEVVVKVLNGCPVNGRYWVFAGGLTDVEVTLVVTDTDGGQQRQYFNPAGTAFQPIQDTAAFDTCP